MESALHTDAPEELMNCDALHRVLAPHLGMPYPALPPVVFAPSMISQSNEPLPL